MFKLSKCNIILFISGLEKREGFSSEVQAVMTKNIESASSLFQQLSHSHPQGASANNSRPQAMNENVGSKQSRIIENILFYDPLFKCSKNCSCSCYYLLTTYTLIVWLQLLQETFIWHFFIQKWFLMCFEVKQIVLEVCSSYNSSKILLKMYQYEHLFLQHQIRGSKWTSL